MDILSALSNHIGPWLPLLAVPLIIFSATPNMPAWYKSGRILFLWSNAIVVYGFTAYENLINPEIVGRWGVKEDAYIDALLAFIWPVFLFGAYIGFFEFLWRCIYRQWAWPLRKNLQYGIVSNLYVLGFVSSILFAFVMFILISMRVF